MTAVTIALRELRERSRLFAVCAALAVLPFLATLLPGARNDRTDVIGAVSGFLAMAMALGSAAAFGGSTVMRDMAERRLSFYFSRPISPASLWIGKATASILSSFACFAIIAIPSALAIGKAWPALWLLTAREIVAMTAGAVIVLFFLVHILASIIRSRSVLIAVDFVMATILVASLVALARPLLTGAALELTVFLGAGIGVAILLILAVAPIWQLANGRTDIRRSHAALSRFLWPSIFAVVAVVAGYVIWVVHPTPADLSKIAQLRQSPGAEWLLASGSTKARGDYRASFLIDGKGGWKRIGMVPWSEMQFSRDGRAAAWFEPVGIWMKESELHTNRGATGIRVSAFSAMCLADDGSRVAIGQGPLVTVYDVSTRKILASAGGFDRRLRHLMFFTSKDVLRVIELTYRNEGGPLRIFEIDVALKKVVKTGETMLPVSALLTASNDGSRIFLRRERRLIDGRTATSPIGFPKRETINTAVLSDGRVVETVREGKRSRLRIYGGREVVLPVEIASIAGELPDGRILVRGTKQMGWSHTGADRIQFIVDADRGEIVQTVPFVKSADWGWGTDPRLIRYDAPRLAGIDREGKIVWWDPRTGRVERPPV